jgi:hypothetical protein
MMENDGYSFCSLTLASAVVNFQLAPTLDWLRRLSHAVISLPQNLGNSNPVI